MKHLRTSFFVAMIALLLASSATLTPPARASSADGLTNLHMQTSAVDIGNVGSGDVYHGTFRLAERTDIPAQVKVYTAPFSMKDQTYEPLYEGAESYRNSIKDWISFPDGVHYTVPANGELDIRFTVKVPSNILGGSQYCAIIVELVSDRSSDLSESSGPVGTYATGRVALPIYASISGPEMLQSGAVTSWDTAGFHLSPPLKTSFAVENTGNVLFSVDYKFEVFDVFHGDTSAYTEEGSRQVFPDTSRTIFHEWANSPHLGIFTVKESITVNGITEEFSQLVIIIPLWLIIIALLIIALAVVAIVRKYKKAQKLEKSQVSRSLDS